MNHYPTQLGEAVVFRELFASPAEVTANGGQIVGAPAWPGRRQGVVLDGVGDHLVYTFGHDLLTATTLAVRFIPMATADSGVASYWFSTTADAHHLQHTAANSIVYHVGGVDHTALLADYTGWWRVGQVNTLVATADGTAVTMWLNGVQIHTSVSAPTFPRSQTLYVGADSAGANTFDGRLQAVEFHRQGWSAEDAQHWHDQTTFNFWGTCQCAVPMDKVCAGVYGAQTPDNSRHGHTVVLGNGTPGHATCPTLSPRGLEFGLVHTSGKYIDLLNPQFGDSQRMTVTFVFQVDETADAGNIRMMISPSAGGCLYYYINAIGSGVLTIQGRTAVPAPVGLLGSWKRSGKNVLTIVSDGTTGIWRFWFNGECKKVWAGMTYTTGPLTSPLRMGKHYSTNNYSPVGACAGFYAWDDCLSPRQVRALHAQLLGGGR